MTISRSHLALTTAGLVGGLALGVTGLAQAADPSPDTSSGPGQVLREKMHDRMGMPGGRMDRPMRGGYGGLVTAIDGDSITVRTPRGTETLGLTGSTTYYEGPTRATRSAVDTGEVVHVRVIDPQATKKVAAVVTVVPAHLGGWVTAVSDSTITITDHNGFTRTIRTSSSTTYLKDGQTATRSAVKVGTMVRAVGEVASDGTTLQASRVATGSPAEGDHPFRGRMGGHMMDGPTA